MESKKHTHALLDVGVCFSVCSGIKKRYTLQRGKKRVYASVLMLALFAHTFYKGVQKRTHAPVLILSLFVCFAQGSIKRR